MPFDFFTALIFLLVSLTSHSLNRFRSGVKSLSMPSLAPVSYTHLDVYKRQVYDIVHGNQKLAAPAVRKNRGKSCAAGQNKEKAIPRRQKAD